MSAKQYNKLGSASRVISDFIFFFFNDTATTEIYTLSLHDALPISCWPARPSTRPPSTGSTPTAGGRSEEHTSELQSPCNLVCRLLLEKKKNQTVLTTQSPHTETPLKLRTTVSMISNQSSRFDAVST